MVNNKNQLEKTLLKKDAEFWYSFFYVIKKSEYSGIFSLWASGYFPLFMVESSKYLCLKQGSNLVSNFGEIRDRNKMYVDKRNSYFEKEVKKIKSLHQQEYIDSHSGFLAPLKRILSCDLGLFYDSNSKKIIGTTHSFHYQNKMDNIFDKNAKNEAIDFGYKMGKYISNFKDSVDLKKVESDSVSILSNLKNTILASKDVKSKHWYSGLSLVKKDVDDYKETFISMWFSFIFSKINFVNCILPKFQTENNIESIFKIKYITLYYFYHNLIILNNNFRNELDSNILEKINQIVSKNFGVKEMVANDKFRNIIVHYKIEDDFLDSEIKPDLKMYGLVEKYHKMTFEEMNTVIDAKILALADIVNFSI